MNLFELFAKISADSSGFDKAVSRAEKAGNSLKNSLSDTFGKIKKIAAGALSVAVIKKGVDSVIDLANATAEAGDRIDKQSQALGLSRKAYQEWDYILGQNGASIDSLGTSMKTLNSLVLSAADGSKEAKDSFSELGLGIHELDGLNVEDQFEAVIRAFQKMPAGAQKSALAVKMFGKNGMELLPLLNQADTSIDELRQRAEELGLIMSDNAVDAAVVYGDSLDDLKKTFTAFKYSIGSQLLPTLTSGIQKVTNYAGKLRSAYESNGLSGVWQTLVSDIKNIKWPTWNDVKNAAIKAWDTIKDGAKSLAGLVFGKAEDGTIAWPDISKLVKDFGAWWDGTALPALQKGMKWTLTLFGVPEAKAEEITSLISGWWDTVVGTATSVLDWALNLPDTPHEAGEQLGKIIGEWWEGVKSYAEGKLNWVLGLFKIGDEEGTSTKEMISTWWTEKVTPLLTDALDFVLGLFGMPDAAEMGSRISDWWTTQVIPDVKDALTYILSLFGLPDAGQMVDKIKDWWSKVKKAVGDLILNIIPQIGGTRQGTITTSSGTTFTDSMGVFGGQDVDLSGLPGVIGHAKGLNYVPYNGYLASLHRGEQILTASQARRNRSGGSSTDIATWANMMISAVREGMNGATVDSYLDGRNVTGGVNRRTMNQLKARRFAT